MVNRIKDEFNKLMQDDNIKQFGYIVDKEKEELIYIDRTQLTKILKLDVDNANYESSSLEQVVNPADNEKLQVNELKEIIESNRVIIYCANTLIEQNSFEVTMNRLLELICNFYGGNYACLFERDYETLLSKVNYKYHYKDVNLIEEEFTKAFTFTTDDVWTTYLKEHHYAFLQTDNDIDNVLINSSYYKRFMESKRKNLLVVSLNDNGKILGAIEIDNVTQNIDNIELIKTICAFIVNNLHIKNVNEDLKENIEDLKTKSALNKTILECVETLIYDEEVRWSTIKLLDIITNYFDAESTSVFFMNFRNEKSEITHAFYDNNILDEVNLDNSPLEELTTLFEKFQANGVGFIPSTTDFCDILQSDFPIIYDIMKERNVETVLFSPLYHQNNIVGFIGVENVKQNIDQVHFVKTIANFVINLIIKDELSIKLEKLNYTDSLTHVYNRNFYDNFIQEFDFHPRKRVGIIFADINALKKANDSFGHELGDKLIKWSARFLKNNINGLVFRIGGDEFVGIIENVTNDIFDTMVSDLNDKLNTLAEKHLSIGSAWADKIPDIKSLVDRADIDMYEDKKKYYQELIFDTRTVKESLEDLRNSIEYLNNH